MKRLKTLLQSKWCYLTFLAGTILITTIRLSLPIHEIKKDNIITGTIEKIQINNESLTLQIKAKEKLQGSYYFKEQEKNKITNLRTGDKIKIVGSLTTPSRPTTKNLFDYTTYLRHQGINHLIKITKIKKISSSQKISDKIKNVLNEKVTHPYIQAFLLGKDEKIAEDVKISYQENGISHLFAISGLHFYLLANIILKILKKVRISEKARYIVCFCLLFFYFLLLDINASILRGILFFFLFSWNQVWKLELSKEMLILLTILVTVLVNPYFLVEPAFWYSFTISIGLLYFSSRKVSYWKSLWCSSTLSFLLSIPISLYYFYQVNILSIIYNLFYIPYVTIIVIPATILTFLIPWLEPIYNLIILVLEKSSLILNSIEIGKFIFPKVNMIVYLLEFLFIILYLKNKKKKIFILMILILLGHKLTFYMRKDFVKVIDVGQGDSILIHSKGQTALIDTGGKFNFNKKSQATITKYITIPLLKCLGIRKLDYILLTHGDMDHMGEIFYLKNHFKVEEIYINLGLKSFLERKLAKEKSLKIANRQLTFQIGNFTLYQLNKAWKEENNSSSVYYVHHSNLKLLFMGDATIETEKYLLENYKLNIDVLKIGHHGSKTSTGISFINATSPRLAIISVGKDNHFNHPSQEVLNILEHKNIPYLMTKDSGTITIFPNTEVITEDKKRQ